jgi:hypothetical protein
MNDQAWVMDVCCCPVCVNRVVQTVPAHVFTWSVPVDAASPPLV